MRQPEPKSLHVMAPEPAPGSDAGSEASTGLRGRRLILARTVWLIVAVLTLYVFVAGVPITYNQALSITPDTRATLAALGLSERFPARFFIATDIID